MKLENVAIAMHCNLRPPDAEVVVLRFNCTTPIPRLKSYNQFFQTYNDFTVDTLYYAVTFTFDPLTLNVCVVLDVT